MELLNTVGKALTVVISWIAMIWSAFWDWFLPSEWAALSVAIFIIGVLVQLLKNKR